MKSPQRAPYGTWSSRITPQDVALAASGLNQVKAEGGALYWLEQRSEEAGRRVVMRRDESGVVRCITPDDYSVRTRVHEYGGGDYCVQNDVVYFASDADQRWYRQVITEAFAEPITPIPPQEKSVRYADAVPTPDGRWLIAVREQHCGEHDVINDIVAIDTTGQQAPRCLVSGQDFYAFPVVNAVGSELAWIAWSHPQMPWDGTVLWVADLSQDARLSNLRSVAGGVAESIYQPAWSPGGVLHFVSDRSGWWNLYRATGEDKTTITPITSLEADMGYPLWVFGTNTYLFLSENRYAVLCQKQGVWQLGIVQEGGYHPCDVPFDDFEPTLAAEADRIYFIAANAAEAPALIEYALGCKTHEVLSRSAEHLLDAKYFSIPLSIAFPTRHGEEAYGFFYPPVNPDFIGPEGEQPPLLMITHGGPTGSAGTALNLKIQYWTSRGFAVMDMNYSGSTGYGRAYRDRLKGQWGVRDVEDCVDAANFLVSEGRVDRDRLLIRGGSAGGYTALCALTFHDVFAAGGSYYGVADLIGLLDDTHKFEARYLDGLVGEYPDQKAIYEARSPRGHADKLSCPIIFLQGLEDRVVPPAQAEAMMLAMNQKKLPYAYLAFEGEQHGFRDAKTIERALQAELFFYAKVLGFTPEEDLPPLDIKHFS